MEITEVQLDEAATPEEVAAVEQVLREAGIDAQVRTDWRKPEGVGNGAMWMLIITIGIPLAAFLKSYGSKLGEEAATSTAEAVRGLVKRLREARKSSKVADAGWVTVQDPQRTTLAIASDTPDEAFDQLEDIDLTAYRGKHLMWDYDRRRWFDPNEDWQ